MNFGRVLDACLLAVAQNIGGAREASDYWDLVVKRAVFVNHLAMDGWEFGRARRKRVWWSNIRGSAERRMILGQFGRMDDLYRRQFGYFATEARRTRRRNDFIEAALISDNHEGHEGNAQGEIRYLKIGCGICC